MSLAQRATESRSDHSRPDRSTLVAALAARRLDRTLTDALPALDPKDDQAVSATTVPALDAPLGGFPRGQLSEVVGARSSGRTSLMLRMLAAATARGELTAVVDALDRFDPASAVAAGVTLDRVLWIRGHVVSHPGAARDTNQKALEQAVKALSLVLQAGNFGLVVFDVGDAPAEALRRLPFTTWLRLQRMVEGQQAVCVLVGSEPMARSAAGLTVNMTVGSRQSTVDSRRSVVDSRQSVVERRQSSVDYRPSTIDHRPNSDGRRFDARLFRGLDVEARVIRARARAHEDISVRLATHAV